MIVNIFVAQLNALPLAKYKREKETRNIFWFCCLFVNIVFSESCMKSCNLFLLFFLQNYKRTFCFIFVVKLLPYRYMGQYNVTPLCCY